MKRSRQPARAAQEGFSLLELMIVAAILMIVLGAVFTSIDGVTQRSQSEQVKVDLTQEAREFVDEFERDIHQSGYPNCRMHATAAVAALSTCPVVNYNSGAVATGLVSVSNTQIIFEGDVDGDGIVDSVRYRVVDQNGNYPPATTCPCTIQRSQVQKVDLVPPLAQATFFSQELQNVVNSGTVAGAAAYTAGSGLAISGNTGWGTSNTSYYAALTTFKDFPVFTAYDQNGNVVALPLDITTVAGQTTLPTIRSIRLTINLLASGVTGMDLKNQVRPVETIVGNGRLVNDVF